MKKAKLLAAVLSVMMLSTIALTGCGQKAAQKAAPTELNLVEASVKTLDSAKATDVASFDIIQNTMETLTVSNNDKPEAGAAEKWESNADGTEWTFHLRKLNWSDDKPVTAKDFEYAWKRILNPDTKSQYAFFLYYLKNGEKYNTGKCSADEVGIKAVDDTTLKITLEQPTPYFLQTTSFALLAPQRQDIVEAQGDKYGALTKESISKMVFCGPYTLQDDSINSKLTLVKNPKYYNAANIKVDKVVLQDIKELKTVYQMFTNKQLDAMGGRGEYLDPLKQGANEKKWQFEQAPQPTVFYIQFNCTGKYAENTKILQSPKVRLALSLSIDRDSYVNQIMKRGIPALGIVPGTIMVNDKEYRSNVEEPLKAVMNQDPKQLFIEGLKDLGLDPDPAKYKLHYLPQDDSTDSRQWAEFFINNWKQKIGIGDIVIDSVASFDDYLKKTSEQKFDLAMAGWGADYNDPYTFIGLFKTGDGNNNGQYSNAEYDNLVKQLAIEGDTTKRLDLFKQAEEILIAKDAGIAPVFYRDRKSFIHNYVKGLQYPAFGGTYQLRYVSVEGK
ncbi:oligopeptide transport system substrate-binding protein [Caloramator quimbayensis]|uniref:Oligopeptide transport system substrate-binding protein n=1 Tax=Caloramator quimbayensis TaxID=1147123 RepID=A0A1T4X506_9CLOT|nr:peptide ABC transporter substrate-binding protein [Caloramator quimbayensis]SKA84626.1 oligopeptide transport system substrate-binding protein [Caloramator quimbayensis]